MFTNYFKIALRNILKNKGHAFINIFGLATGIACTALILLWVENEISFNKSISNADYIYNIKNTQTYDQETFVFDATPGPLAKNLKNEIPGIKYAARSTWSERLLTTIDGKKLYINGNHVDPSFLNIVNPEFIKGNPQTALKEINSIIITEKTAQKLFGTNDVVGKSINVNNTRDAIVSAVVKDLPLNTSFSFEWLAPFEIFEKEQAWLKEWGNNGILTYVELEKNTDVKALNVKLENYLKTKNPNTLCHLSVYPMNRWHLYNSFDKAGKESDGLIRYVRLFAIIALIVLLIACINFMNLATARSEKRSREVGIRKVLGSRQNGLILQFLSESVIMSFLAGFVAQLLVYISIPYFNLLLNKHLEINVLQPTHLFSFIGILLLCGIVSGSYPAFYLSSFKPVTTIKGFVSGAGSKAGYFRKGLVVLQYSTSIVFIISTFVIYKQIELGKTQDAGFTKESVIYTVIQGKLESHFDAVKNDLLNTGVVQNVCLSAHKLIDQGSNTGDFTWDGKDVSKPILITLDWVSPEFMNTMGIKLKEGRDFSSNADVDSMNVIINESFAKLIGSKDVIGKQILYGDSKLNVIGITKDFLYNNMYSGPAPMVFFSGTSNAQFMAIRFKSQQNPAVAIEKVKSIINKYNSEYPFEYSFLDEQFEKYFKSETLINRLSGIFAILALLISCLGLYGLASYMAEKRSKEISIRKVLGASVQNLTTLLTGEYVKLVAVSCLIAFPVSYWYMNNWLKDYENRIHLSWTFFAGAGVMAVCIAIITVGFRAMKVAGTKPVKNLRAE